MRKTIPIALTTLILTILIISTACEPAPATTPAPEPVTPETPAATPEPSPEPAPAPEPEPVTPPETEPEREPTPDSEPEELELDLVEIAPSSYQLDVTPVYAGHDVCMLGSLTMLLKYDDPTLDFCDLIGNIGMGITGTYRLDKQTGTEFQWSAPDSRWAGMVYAPQNLGYGVIVGVATGGRIDEKIIAPPNVPQSILEQKPRVQKEAKRIEYFDSVDDGFEFLKRVVASGYPVEVHLNMVQVMHDLAEASSNWATTAETWTQGGLTAVSHFMVVTGYDETYVYMNDPTDPDKPANLPATINNFKAAWDVPEGLYPNDTGPYWMLFLKKGAARKAIDDIIAWNKERAAETPSQIRLFGENTLGDFTSYSVEKEIFVTSEVRAAYAEFLEKNGKSKAAALYEQSSQLWEGLLASDNVSTDIMQIADLEEQAWSLY